MTARDARRRVDVRIVAAGDAALVAEFEPRIDPRINARAVALARALCADRIDGVLDIVPAFRTVTVYFDPLATRLQLLLAAIRRHAAEGAHVLDVDPRTPIDVPVCYGGDLGPDLPDVARQSGLSEAQVVDRHAGAIYRVFMLGFVPGFAYLGLVDPAIAVARHAAPRVHVPAGAVALAGELTAVYPGGTPGGWQIIGRTHVRPYDASSAHALFRPGDAVRFRAIDRGVYEAGAEATVS